VVVHPADTELLNGLIFPIMNTQNGAHNPRELCSQGR
jgi:hypothetical protein